jgi:hypothetical protein
VQEGNGPAQFHSTSGGASRTRRKERATGSPAVVCHIAAFDRKLMCFGTENFTLCPLEEPESYSAIFLLFSLFNCSSCDLFNFLLGLFFFMLHALKFPRTNLVYYSLRFKI